MESHHPSSVRAEIFDRISRRLVSLGKSPRAASIEAGLSPDAIRDIGRKQHSLPRIDTIAALAGVLKTSPEWLAFGVGGEPKEAQHDTVAAVPFFEWAEAKNIPTPLNSVAYSQSRKSIFAELPTPGNYIAISVEGGESDLLLPRGATAIVNVTERDLRHKSFYFCKTSERVLILRYMDSPRRLEPYSTNRDYEAYAVEDIEVIGRVVQVVIKL